MTSAAPFLPPFALLWRWSAGADALLEWRSLPEEQRRRFLEGARRFRCRDRRHCKHTSSGTCQPDILKRRSCSFPWSSDSRTSGFASDETPGLPENLRYRAFHRDHGSGIVPLPGSLQYGRDVADSVSAMAGLRAPHHHGAAAGADLRKDHLRQIIQALYLIPEHKKSRPDIPNAIFLIHRLWSISPISSLFLNITTAAAAITAAAPITAQSFQVSDVRSKHLTLTHI